MRIAFISLNQEKLPDPVVPIGLLYVLANTPAHHETVLWDLCFEPEPVAYLEARMREFQPELVALGMRNIQNADYSGSSGNLARYKKVIAALRGAGDAPILIGGSGFSVMPEALMRELGPDYGIAGEGEGTFPLFLEALEAGERDFSRIGSFFYFEDGEVVSNRSGAPLLDLNALAPPDLGLAHPRYFSHVGTAAVQSKRGCPLKCTYCTYPTIEGATKRLRKPASFADEMCRAVARQPQIEHFFVVDSVFNLPSSHAKEICRELVRREFSVPWTPYINPIGFDEELAELMRAAGCTGIEVGSDSGVERVLRALKKGFSTRQIRELSRISKAAGLKDCHSFILGTPGETIEEVGQTLEFVAALDPYCAILSVWVDDDEALAGLPAPRRAMRGEMRELLSDFGRKFPQCVIPSLRLNFDEKFFDFLRRKKCRGPLWQSIRPRLQNLKEPVIAK